MLGREASFYRLAAPRKRTVPLAAAQVGSYNLSFAVVAADAIAAMNVDRKLARVPALVHKVGNCGRHSLSPARGVEINREYAEGHDWMPET